MIAILEICELHKLLYLGLCLNNNFDCRHKPSKKAKDTSSLALVTPPRKVRIHYINFLKI